MPLLVVALAGCSTGAQQELGALAGALQAGELVPLTDRLKALHGEWRLLSGSGASRQDRLTIWSPMFSWGSGCNISQGQLRDLGEGRYSIEALGGTQLNCRTVRPLAPFDGDELRIVELNDNTIRVERGDESWVFAEVDVAATIPSEDFVRGEWLLADTRGRPYRGKELTRVTFGPEYRVDAPTCSIGMNAWFGDRDWQVQVGGSYIRQSGPCRTRTLGDRLAKLGSAAVFVAVPVETRMTVRIGGNRAVLVPAIRFPDLAADAEAIAPDPWARELAVAAARMPGEQRDALALRAVGLGGEGMTGIEMSADPRSLAFAGLTAWHYARAQEAKLVPAPAAGTRSLAENFAIAPIVVRAVLEGIRPADRGDGLSLDYLYRVRESWRGGRRTGDLLIVRMPPLEGKSRSSIITPETGAKVLLLASRTGYIAGRLIESVPPLTDTRVVQMTLPLMRIVDDYLLEANEGTDVLGAASFSGISIVQARALARSVDEQMNAIAPEPEARSQRYLITRIDNRVLTDPTRLWIDHDGQTNFGGPRGYGGVTAYFDGCTRVERQSQIGGNVWASAAVACPGHLPDGSAITEPAVAAAVQWMEENGFPDIICVSTCPADPEYTVPLPGGEMTMRAMLK